VTASFSPPSQSFAPHPSYRPQNEDTVQAILRVLIEDPLLRWDKLTGRSDAKDVRFFLRAFETNLRAIANATLEYHASSFFRTRIRYISSRICERFGLSETPTTEDSDQANYRVALGLETIEMDELDPTLMPPFSKIRDFMFGGDVYRGLQDDIRNFTDKPRDYISETMDIIVKYVHPPEQLVGSNFPVQEDDNALRNLLNTFLLSLTTEAGLRSVSATDSVGIKEAKANILDLTSRLCTF
jgi:hypothetical protein